MIPILRVEDLHVALNWYELLGFTLQWERRSEPGQSEPAGPAFVEIAKGEVRLFLSQERGSHSPDAEIYLRVHDVESIAAEFGMTTADAAWAREIELRDPDGNRIRVGTPNL